MVVLVVGLLFSRAAIDVGVVVEGAASGRDWVRWWCITPHHDVTPTAITSVKQPRLRH